MSQEKQKPILLIAFFTAFLDLMGFGLIIPIQPFYAQSFGATPTIITLLGASYSLMQLIFSPMMGRISDRVGRKPVLATSVLLIIIGYLVFGTAGSITGLFIGRMISGLGGSNLGAVQAIIADVTTPENRSKGMGLIGAAFGLGFIIGPALGGFLGQYGPTTPIFAAALLAGVNLMLTLFVLPETLKGRAEPKPSLPLKQLLKSENLKTLYIITLTYTVAFALMEQCIGLYIDDQWVKNISDLSADEQIKEASRLTAYFLVLVGIAATIVQGGLISRLTKRYGEVVLARIGIGVVMLMVGLIPMTGIFNRFDGLLLIALLMATGSGLLNPSRSALLSRGAPAAYQGQALGISHSLAALGRIIGPAMAGILFEYNVSVPFWCASVIMLLAFGLSFWLTQPHVQTQSTPMS